MELKNVIRQMVENFAQDTKSMIGKVTEVDVNERTCTVLPLQYEKEDDELVIYDVMFQAGGSSNSGLTLVPKIDSLVMVSFIEEDTAYISLMSDVDKISIKSEQEDLKAILTDMLTAIEQLTVPTGVGPSGVPINLASFTQIKQRLNNLFE